MVETRIGMREKKPGTPGKVLDIYSFKYKNSKG